MDKLIEDIIALEWSEFQNVNNEGGRASCQDNFKSFHIYRKSQFLAWNGEMLESYHNDLLHAIKIGRNLLTEKYARMMESTAPENYKSIKNMLPEISEEKEKLINNISKITIKWAEEYAKEYPMLSGNGRPIHASEDGPYYTSVETYARGELSTYSEETLKLYYEHVKHLLSENKNLSKMITENTVKEYGYSTMDEAESRMSQKQQNSYKYFK